MKEKNPQILLQPSLDFFGINNMDKKVVISFGLGNILKCFKKRFDLFAL